MWCESLEFLNIFKNISLTVGVLAVWQATIIQGQVTILKTSSWSCLTFNPFFLLECVILVVLFSLYSDLFKYAITCKFI